MTSKFRLFLCKLDFHSYKFNSVNATLDNGKAVEIPFLRCEKCGKVATRF